MFVYLYISFCMYMFELLCYELKLFTTDFLILLLLSHVSVLLHNTSVININGYNKLLYDVTSVVLLYYFISLYNFLLSPYILYWG